MKAAEPRRAEGTFVLPTFGTPFVPEFAELEKDGQG
jgi:hypothetical protein